MRRAHTSGSRPAARHQKTRWYQAASRARRPSRRQHGAALVGAGTQACSAALFLGEAARACAERTPRGPDRPPATKNQRGTKRPRALDGRVAASTARRAVVGGRGLLRVISRDAVRLRGPSLAGFDSSGTCRPDRPAVSYLRPILGARHRNSPEHRLGWSLLVPHQARAKRRIALECVRMTQLKVCLGTI